MYLLENRLGFEGNPVARFFLSQGYLGLIVLKLIGVSLIVALFTVLNFKNYNQNLMAYPSLIIGMAVVWNISVIL